MFDMIMQFSKTIKTISGKKFTDRRVAAEPGLVAAVLAANGALAREVCGFDFAQRYGERGKDFAECHHIIPLADLVGAAKTRLQELAIVCANCHRMIHRRLPTLTLDELRALWSRVATTVA